MTLKVKRVMKKVMTAVSNWNDKRNEQKTKEAIDENELGLELNIMELSKSMEKDNE
jgi:predicted HTH domain antitoxin